MRARNCIVALLPQVDDGPCVMYIGAGGAGNFVKMVHNGIEYGDMQLISEVRDSRGARVIVAGPFGLRRDRGCRQMYGSGCSKACRRSQARELCYPTQPVYLSCSRHAGL
jgi:hypothetical protein